MKPIIKFKEGIERNQEVLIPKTVNQYVSENHLTRLIIAICAMIDITNIISKYKVKGQHAYDPRMMIAILFYGYAIGIRSSRKLAECCKYRLDFMFLTGSNTPSHDRISDFRKDALEELKDVFKQIVLIGADLGLVNIGNLKVSIDGTKIRANASAKLTKDEEGLKKLLDATRKQIEQMFIEAEKVDVEEDKLYGKQNTGLEIPKNIQSKEGMKKAVSEVIQNLHNIEEKIRDKKDAEIVDDTIQRKLKEIKKIGNDISSANAKAEAIEVAMEKLKEEKEDLKNKITKEKGREPTKSELKDVEKKKINVTDHDAKFMLQRNGVIKPNFNAQIAVDEGHQFIVANDVTTECNDQRQLIPTTQKVIDTTGHTPKQVTSDNGYFNQLEKAVSVFPTTVFLVDDANRRKEVIDLDEIKKKYSKTKFDNLITLLSDEGKEEYKKRMYTVEPPFGDMKYNKGYLAFLPRGIEKVKGEFNIMCIGYNLKKIFSFLTEKGMNIKHAIEGVIKNKMLSKSLLRG